MLKRQRELIEEINSLKYEMNQMLNEQKKAGNMFDA
jgi:hypothetical protein